MRLNRYLLSFLFFLFNNFAIFILILERNTCLMLATKSKLRWFDSFAGLFHFNPAIQSEIGCTRRIRNFAQAGLCSGEQIRCAGQFSYLTIADYPHENEISLDFSALSSN